MAKIKWKCLWKVTKKTATPEVHLRKPKKPTKEEVIDFAKTMGVIAAFVILIFGPLGVGIIVNSIWPLLIYLLYGLLIFAVEVKNNYEYYCLNNPDWYIREQRKEEEARKMKEEAQKKKEE